MIKSITKKTNNKKGFTLIELIVVIAILGILAAIAIPRLGGFTDNAAVAARDATARTIASAVTMAEASNNTPATAPSLSEIEAFLNGVDIAATNSVASGSSKGVWGVVVTTTSVTITAPDGTVY